MRCINFKINSILFFLLAFSMSLSTEIIWAQQCAIPLEFDHEFHGESPPIEDSTAILLLRRSDRHFRFIASHPSGGVATKTVEANYFRCFSGGTPIDCCNDNVNRIIFSYQKDNTNIQGNVLLSPYNRAVVDVVKDFSRARYLLMPCSGSAPIISGGRNKYERKFHGKVFRRGQDTPQFKIEASKILKESKPVVDIFKIGDKKRVKRIETFSKKGPFFIATWDWSNERGWKIPSEIRVGIYEVIAKSIKGVQETENGKCYFYVIFQKPESLQADLEGAYLYNQKPSERDELSIHYLYSGSPYQQWVLDKNLQEKREQRYKRWFEKEYKLNPFNEHLFDLAINAVDSQTKESEAANGLMKAVSRVIVYNEKNTFHPQDVSKMFKPVTAEDFRKAFSVTEKPLINGQCLDYANSLSALTRSIGIPARVATDIQRFKFHYHEWTEIFLESPPEGTDKWFTYDAMDYPNENANEEGASPRSKAPYGRGAFEVVVGDKNWTIKPAPGEINIDFPISRAKRINNVDDALFEKCENKKYDTTGCGIDPPVQESSDNLIITLNNDTYRIGDNIIADIAVINNEDNDLSATLSYRIFRFAQGDDGRGAFGDPILGIPGSGILGEVIFEVEEDIIVPANSQILKQYTFVAADTKFPVDQYLAEVRMNSTSIEDIVSVGFSVLPAYDVTINHSLIVGPLNPVPIELSISNHVNFTITNIAINVEIPDFYTTTDSLSATIPSLDPGETKSIPFNLSPIEKVFVGDISLLLTITSDNGGSLLETLIQDIEIPPTLLIPSTVIKVTPPPEGEEITFPISFTIQNIGDLDTTNITVNLLLPDDIPPGSVILEDNTFIISALDSGEEKVLSTNITTSLSKDFHMALTAADEDGHTASSIISIIMSCTDNRDCPSGSYCAKAPGDCDGQGKCTEIPTICPLLFDPVCGCDGTTYENFCIAAGTGVNVAHEGVCK